MRTKNTFISAVDADLIWRKRELINIQNVIKDSKDNHAIQAVLLRAGVALLYAHWEGFVKCSGSYYLEFVSLQGKKGTELTTNFISIKIKSLLQVSTKSNKAFSTNELVDFFNLKFPNKLPIPFKGVVDTQSNLSSSVLFDILSTLGLSNNSYLTKKQLIDSSLVNRRNQIVHGENLGINFSDYLELHSNIIGLLDLFRNEIQNAAVTNHFLK
jgi:MAE_28990/MAE_18760-like HEPN